MERVAKRMAGMQKSVIRTMTDRCAAAGGINLGQGLCQVDPPGSLLELGQSQFADLNHSYTDERGDADFLHAVAAKLARDNGIHADPGSQIVTCTGVTGALNATLMALFNPGDGILLIEPFYGYHLSAIRMMGLVPEPVHLTGPDFRLSEDLLRAAVT
ncbi:MAG: aminotransferase class I/II-fold pyridoxal phosphate-dependent enzyme, partial [Trebonia sp.]